MVTGPSEGESELISIRGTGGAGDCRRVTPKIEMEAAMKRRSEAGQALILAAVALVVLLATAGVAVDMGVARYEKRTQQTAADAAALAGASNISFGGVISGGQAAAAANGYTDNGGGQASTCTAAGAAIGKICVQINNPPASGPHTNDPKYVEAIVAAVHQTYFMNILRVFSDTVTARAVATDLSGGGPGNGCVYTLGPPSSSIEGVNINGNATLNAPTCGIVDNGNFNTKGNALVVNASTFGTAGNWNASGPGGTVTCSETPSSCPTQNMPATGNPLGSLTPPPVGNPVNFNPANIVPGTYNSISLTGNGPYTFPPGIYVLSGAGGFSCSGTPTIPGTGVMFYFTNNATFNCQGNDTIHFTAPTPTNCAGCPAQYDGILFYQDPNDTAGPSIGGNTGTTYDGALYFPKSQVTFFGNNNTLTTGLVVADALGLSGHPTVNVLGTAGLGAQGISINALATAVLVE